jgi:hypothetical protein
VGRRRIEQQRGDHRDLFEKENTCCASKRSSAAMEDSRKMRIDAT